MDKLNNKYYDLFVNATEAICFLNDKGIITEVNHQTIKLTEYSKDELVGMHVAKLVHPEDREKSRKYFEKLVHSGSYKNYEGRIITKSGKEKFIEVNSHLFYRNEMIIGSIDFIRDISARKRLEIKILKQSIKLKEVNKEIAEKNTFLEEDLKLAQKIQLSTFPDKELNYKQLQTFIKYLPLNKVGGDIYDIYEIHSGCIRCFLADAIGHGVQAALVTMLIKAEYESIKKETDSPGILLDTLNNIFSTKYNILNLFFTAIICDFNFNKNTLIVASAGHPEQYLLNGDNLIEVQSDGISIGVNVDVKFGENRYPFCPKDKLFIYSDGLFEIFNKTGEEFGQARIRNLIIQLKNKSLNTIIDTILQSASEFKFGKHFHDDITVLGFARL